MRLGMGLGLGNLLSGGPITGFPNKYSFNFDGSNQTLDLSDAEFPSGNSAFTISCWFNKTSSVSYAGLVSWGTATTHQANFLNFDDAGHVKAGFFGNDLENGSGTVTSTGVWYHAVVTYDGTTRRIYVNGSEEVSDTPSSVNVTLGGTLRIGTTVDGNYDFDGHIDEVAVWNTALDASTIAKIASKPVDLTKYSASNLKLWLRAGDKAEPESNTAIARQDFYTEFDGTDDFVDCGSVSSSVFSDSYDGGLTLQSWFKTDNVDDYQGIVEIGLVSGGHGTIQLMINPDTDKSMLRVNGASASVESGTTIVANQWYHVSGVFDGANNELKLYLNGVLSGTTSYSSALDFSTYGRQIDIGRMRNNLEFNGAISSVSIYQTALDAQTISQFAKSRFTPMRDNRFSVVDFDGSNDFIDIPDNDALDVGSGDMTITFWYNPLSMSANMEIIDKYDTSSNKGYRVRHHNGTSKVWFNINDGADSDGYYSYIDVALSYGQWYHVTIIWDNSEQQATYYINGVNYGRAFSTALRSIGDTSNSVPLRFGGTQAGGSDYKGSISSIAIYNVARTSEEDYACYQKGITHNPSTDTGLVGLWRMGDDTSKAFPTIADSSSNSNDGTMTNMASDDIVQQMVAGYDMGAFESSSEELGGEIAQDNTFSNTTNSQFWNGQSSISNNKLHILGSNHGGSISGNCFIDQNSANNAQVSSNPLLSGKLYKVTGIVTVNSLNGSEYIRSNFDTSNTRFFPSLSVGTESFTIYIVANGTFITIQIPNTGADTNISIDAFSIKEVLQSADLSDTYPAIIDVNEPVLGVNLVDANTNSNWESSGSNTIGNITNGISITYVDNTVGSYAYLRDSKLTSTDLTVGAIYKLTYNAYYSGGSGNPYVEVYNAAVSFNGDAITTTDTSYSIYFNAAGDVSSFVRIQSMSSSNVLYLTNLSLQKVSGNTGVMTNQASSNLVYSSVLPDQSFLATGVNSAYNFIDLDGSDQSISGSISRGDAITEFTFSSWTNIDSFGDYERIFSGDDGTVRAGFRSTGKFTFHPNLTIGDTDSTGSSYSTGQWYHTMVTYNKATTTLKYYRDGDLAFTKDDCSSSDMDISGLFWIGSYRGIALFLDGSVGQTAIWDRDLSSDVGSIYNLGRHGNLLDSYSDNLLGYFAMGALDASTGLSDSISTIYDRSGNSNHGTPQNADAGDLKSSPNAEPNGYAKGDTNRSTTTP